MDLGILDEIKSHHYRRPSPRAGNLVIFLDLAGTTAASSFLSKATMVVADVRILSIVRVCLLPARRFASVVVSEGCNLEGKW